MTQLETRWHERKFAELVVFALNVPNAGLNRRVLQSNLKRWLGVATFALPITRLALFRGAAMFAGASSQNSRGLRSATLASGLRSMAG